ncbi:hypothetical protein N8683_02380 [bacterium]|nr:hypothetical protein [bacterium]
MRFYLLLKTRIEHTENPPKGSNELLTHLKRELEWVVRETGRPKLPSVEVLDRSIEKYSKLVKKWEPGEYSEDVLDEFEDIEVEDYITPFKIVQNLGISLDRAIEFRNLIDDIGIGMSPEESGFDSNLERGERLLYLTGLSIPDLRDWACNLPDFLPDEYYDIKILLSNIDEIEKDHDDYRDRIFLMRKTNKR